MSQDDENMNSLVMKVYTYGITTIMDGDIDAELEQKLINQYGASLSCTIMKAAHHGSKYSNSEAFMDACSPEVMVFQVGKNNYGHPSPETISKLENCGVIVYTNLESGAVGFRLSRRGIKCHTVL